MDKDTYKKLVHFPNTMKEDIEKAAKSENRNETNYIVTVIKNDIENKKKEGIIK